MLYPISILSIILLILIHLTHGHDHGHGHTPQQQHSQDASHPPPHFHLPEDTIPYSTRAHWMRRANAALAEIESPCPFGAFGTAVVNHTDTSHGPLGKLVCIGVNRIARSGNPTLHGEIAAIENCSSIFTDPDGEYKMGGMEALGAFKGLSLYTNGEPCPMCASAIRWAGFSECIFGTNSRTLVNQGWTQMSLSTEELFEKTCGLAEGTRLVKDVLANETDPFFAWQYDESGECPTGCARTDDGSSCQPNSKGRDEL